MRETSPLLKRSIRNFFKFFGLKVSRIASPKPLAAKYFNTGELSPHEENSVTLYDSFYKDTSAVEDYYSPERVSFYEGVVRYLKEQGLTLNGKDVADVGCGVGYLLSEIRKNFKPGSLHGYDFSAQAIEYSRKKFCGSSFTIHDIYHTVPSTFDVVFCTEVLEHLEFPHKALAQLEAATRSGGILILTVPNGRVDSLIEHINFWSPESWKAFLQRECPTLQLLHVSTLFEGNVNIAVLRRGDVAAS
ncbi:class I SAM-dependent methyltransferase [Roseateles oligotrophus]|uniref:Class I SAM-dependent methyltransferase n=1 Tax=Roseateles oligotrophus TaxID=1769250 RepID=A0ABT2YDX8_9BURK|nr:class I SAM-dependent methyltransferase [Roseateles oligotrophus]MCV2368255.1 class I SAM-dependent methyltransferase [Roseateles oligotrophus]